MEKANDLYGNILNILKRYRSDAYKAVNTAMVISYWQIGKEIVENEQGGNVKASYGDEILQSLSKKLTTAFGKGFSYANLRNFRQFYLTYPEEQICYAVRSISQKTDSQANEISYALRSNLSWTHHQLIKRVDDVLARTYYLREADQMYLPTDKQLADWIENDKAIIELQLKNQGID
ncbi:DUF1016 N-terminal domain-containing protein [Pedobacter sp. BG31]|uniref:DUF1016 N-terminal domain-containing protein n=1 Tax=Pedobacter sp. BG31 TaxID=3349697 RepID=UPI0035F39BB3